jgi:predicted metal-dependent hydrolase
MHYKIIYSRRRSIGISIGPDSGVIVRAPYRTSQKTIENVVHSKSAWIKKHLENHSSLIRINQNRTCKNGEFFYFCGRLYSLIITESENNYVKHYGGVIEIGVKSKDDNDKVRLLMEKWYKKMAEEVFRKKLQEVLYKYRHHNFSLSGFAIRTMKGRWGSCTSKGKITLSAELVKLDEKYSEYVMLHELCHLKHHNHSPAYYQLLTEVYPEWKTVRKELRRFIR